MRCLLCTKELSEGSLKDIVSGEDEICEECRKKFIKRKIKFEVEGVKGEADYVYEENFSKALIQFKECKDEALKNIFLFEVKKRLKWKYRGRTILLMPSSETKLKERGFHHLKEMFECTQMKILDAFVKENDDSQKERSKKEREEMIHGMHLKQGIKIPKKVLLVDDTITTGSTLKGALRCLKNIDCDIRIYCVSANQSWI